MSKPIQPSRIFAAVCVAALLSPAGPAAASSTERQSFPAQFRGDWYGEPGTCDPSKLALQIGETRLNYFDEFSGDLTRVIRQTESSIHYVAAYSAEGHRWDATETLQLSANGKEMTLEPERTSPRYFRCNGAG